ncbi:MAG: hypothetical protein IKT42_00905 [Clostridia bacterium]|nr:hypothetical protein [Clostridia bacterium]
MKKIICLTVVAVMMLAMLVGCGESAPSGEYYSADLGFSVVFEDDNKLTISYDAETSIVFDYEIKDGQITMTYDGETETVPFTFDGEKLSIDGDEFIKLK